MQHWKRQVLHEPCVNKNWTINAKAYVKCFTIGSWDCTWKKKEKEEQIKGSITLSITLNMFLFSSVFHTYNMRSQPKNNNKVWNGSRLANCSWLWNSTRALGDLFVAEHSSLKLVSGPVLAGISRHNPRRNSGLSSFIPQRPCSQNRVWLWNMWWVFGCSVYTFTPNPSIYSFVL